MLLQLSKTVKQSPKSPQIFENNGTFCADRPFSKNRSETNCQKSFVFNQLVSELQSYILSTTTETGSPAPRRRISLWLQSYILSTTTETDIGEWSRARCLGFNRTSFQQQLKPNRVLRHVISSALQSYILSTTTETHSRLTFLQERTASIVHPFNNN